MKICSARLIVVPLTLLLIFILLFSTFNSVKQALLIYTGIPFAVVGGVLALALRLGTTYASLSMYRNGLMISGYLPFSQFS